MLRSCLEFDLDDVLSLEAEVGILPVLEIGQSEPTAPKRFSRERRMKRAVSFIDTQPAFPVDGFHENDGLLLVVADLHCSCFPEHGFAPVGRVQADAGVGNPGFGKHLEEIVLGEAVQVDGELLGGEKGHDCSCGAGEDESVRRPCAPGIDPGGAVASQLLRTV